MLPVAPVNPILAGSITTPLTVRVPVIETLPAQILEAVKQFLTNDLQNTWHFLLPLVISSGPTKIKASF